MLEAICRRNFMGDLEHVQMSHNNKRVTRTRKTRTEPAGFGCFSGFYRVRAGSGLRGEVSKPGGKNPVNLSTDFSVIQNRMLP